MNVGFKIELISTRKYFIDNHILHYIFTAGDRFYLIHSGQFEVSRDGQPVARLGEGDFFGEAALITGGERNATVRALEAAELFSLGKDQFDRALEQSADFKSGLLATFFQRLP